MTTVQVNAVGVHAGSRDRAVCMRDDIRSALRAGDSVRIDFEGVESVTQSFADELFGRSIREFGTEALRRIVFSNCTDGVRHVIAVVIHYSLAHVDNSSAASA